MVSLYNQIRTALRDNGGPTDLILKYSSSHIPDKPEMKRDVRRLVPDSVYDGNNEENRN